MHFLLTSLFPMDRLIFYKSIYIKNSRELALIIKINETDTFSCIARIIILSKLLFIVIGLLAMALEPYLKGEVPDIKIAIISISYERTLEENLYAFEILGIPKPKESTMVTKNKSSSVISKENVIPTHRDSSVLWIKSGARTSAESTSTLLIRCQLQKNSISVQHQIGTHPTSVLWLTRTPKTTLKCWPPS